MSRPWIKSWDNKLDNPKVMRLPSAEYKTWDLLCLIANRTDKGGVLPTLSQCAYVLHTSEETLGPLVDALVKAKLIDRDGETGTMRIHDWHNWQSAPPSENPDAWRERKRKERERQRESEEGRDVSRESRNVTRDNSGHVTNVTDVTSGQNMSRVAPREKSGHRSREASDVTSVTDVTTEMRGDENRLEEKRETQRDLARDAGGPPAVVAEYPPAFERVYQAYPKHANKRDALRVWQRLKPNAALVKTMLAAIEAQRAGRQWRAGYVKGFDSWLRGEHWLDEVEAPDPSAGRSGKVVPIRPAGSLSPEPVPEEELTPAERAWRQAGAEERAAGFPAFLLAYNSHHAATGG